MDMLCYGYGYVMIWIWIWYGYDMDMDMVMLWQWLCYGNGFGDGRMCRIPKSCSSVLSRVAPRYSYFLATLIMCIVHQYIYTCD